IELLEWGYTYVALGGLARAKTTEILEILQAIAPSLRPETDLHLFGVARDREKNEMEIFRKLGVTSFDSASYLRRAWMSATTNYFTEDGGRYGALRISPVYASSPRVKTIVADGIATIEQLQKLEREALLAVRDYDRGDLDLETTLNTLLEIDRLEEYNYDQHKELYRKVLTDMPWKKCTCEVCRQIGVEVIIFRGNDRNRRRGFHNTYVFYKRFRKLIEGSKEK
ncbi:MAG TPA: tRNA-guanine transglycosylase DpdA, partial [Ktedonobacteraceae bacterium]|nr:tRNA-guanine transglycosylase DpdA [Ktedonobacteraceae bacterium]